MIIAQQKINNATFKEDRGKKQNVRKSNNNKNGFEIWIAGLLHLPSTLWPESESRYFPKQSSYSFSRTKEILH